MLKAFTVKLMTSAHHTFFIVCQTLLFSHQDYTGGAGVYNALILADKLGKQTSEQEQKTQMQAFI